MSQLKKTLTIKEKNLAWDIICWFNKPITSSLKYKLYPGDVTYHYKDKKQKRYQKMILKRIVELGENVKNNHPDWIE